MSRPVPAVLFQPADTTATTTMVLPVGHTPATEPVSVGEGFGLEDWLSAYRSPSTRAAYTRDATGWLSWCSSAGVHPAAARRPDADAWRTHLEDTRLAERSIARKIAAVSSLYG